jgi:hypothetical protein
MHYLYFVAIPKKGTGESEWATVADTPDEAMSLAEQELNNNGFAGEGGYFSNCKADWYVVGGRWCDFFTDRQEWAKQAVKEIEVLRENYKDKHGEKLSVIGTHYGSAEDTKKQKELREKAELIWGRHRPPEYPKVRYDRHTGDDGEMIMGVNSIEDCAELVTPELVKYIHDYDKYNPETKTYAKDPSSFSQDGMEVFVIDRDGGTEENKVSEWLTNPDVVGKYWLVIIDYHN